jgi:hypothetical protein
MGFENNAYQPKHLTTILASKFEFIDFINELSDMFREITSTIKLKKIDSDHTSAFNSARYYCAFRV